MKTTILGFVIEVTRKKKTGNKTVYGVHHANSFVYRYREGQPTDEYWSEAQKDWNISSGKPFPTYIGLGFEYITEAEAIERGVTI